MTTHINTNRATTFGELVTPGQLYWLNVAARSVGMCECEQALALFGCPVADLTKDAANKLLVHFAHVKQEKHD